MSVPASTATWMTSDKQHSDLSTASITSNSSASTWSQCSVSAKEWSRQSSDVSNNPMFSTATSTTTIAPSPSKLANKVLQCSAARRKRSRSNSRRFVITELPLDPEEWSHSDVCHEDDEEENDSTANQSETASICSSDDISGDCPLVPPSTPLTRVLRHPRPNKMEVRGRFTIIDLSPEFPQTCPESSTPEESTLRPDSRSTMTARRPIRAPPRRCTVSTASTTSTELPRPLRSPVYESVLDMARTQLHQHTQHTLHLRTDLNAFDRHLEFLQQESSDMKTLLESMVSSNSRWIEALVNTSSSSENGNERDTELILQQEEEQQSEKPENEELQMKPSPPHLKPPPPRPPSPSAHRPPLVSVDDQLIALKKAYHELDLKYETLLRQNTQIERSNIMLETRLRQEMTLNDELRAHVDQLTQYTESLILAADPFPECDEKEVTNECLDEQLKQVCHLVSECSPSKSKPRRRRRNSLVTVITMEDDSSDEHILPCPLTAPSSVASSSNHTAPVSNGSLNQHEGAWSYCHQLYGSNQSLVGCDDLVENESIDEDHRDVHSDMSSQCDGSEDWALPNTAQEPSNQAEEASSLVQEWRPSFPSRSHSMPANGPTTAQSIAKKAHPEKPIYLRRGTPSPEKSTLSLLASPNTVFRQIRHAPR